MEDAATIGLTSSEKKTERVGWGLLLLALVTPLVMSGMGLIDARYAGSLMMYVGFAWLCSALVIDFFTRRKSGTTKANGRIVSAVAAMVTALFAGVVEYRDTSKVDSAKQELIQEFMAATVEARSLPADPAREVQPVQVETAAPVAEKPPTAAHSSKADRSVALLNAMKARMVQFAKDSGAVDRKFNAIDLSTVLAPENLVAKEKIAASNAKLLAFKSAIKWRDDLLLQHFVITEKLINDSQVTDIEKSEALRGLNESRGSTEQSYADLTRVQMASVSATEKLLALAQRGLGKNQFEGGQLMFTTQADLDEYQRLLAELNASAEREVTLTQSMAERVQRTKKDMVEQLK